MRCCYNSFQLSEVYMYILVRHAHLIVVQKITSLSNSFDGLRDTIVLNASQYPDTFFIYKNIIHPLFIKRSFVHFDLFPTFSPDKGPNSRRLDSHRRHMPSRINKSRQLEGSLAQDSRLEVTVYRAPHGSR